MRMKLSDYIADFLAGQGVRHVFVVTGGASIHILHSLRNRPGTEPVCPHHEQAGAMAADAYARVTGGIGCAVGTSGPGATNMITGIAGAWFDSVPVLYITGQVTTFRLKRDSGVRQFGFQETDIVPMVAPITKNAVQLSDPMLIRHELEKAVHIARSGRPGPVLLDVPDDLQREIIETDDLEGFASAASDAAAPAPDDIARLREMLSQAERPVLILGSGVRLAGVAHDAVRLAEIWGVPVLTSWGAKDLIVADHPLNIGTFGTHGTRAGNFAMQNADLVVAVGARLSTRETGAPLTSWARGAATVVIDIDPAELNKFPAFERPLDLAIRADAGAAIGALLTAGAPATGDLAPWRRRIDAWREAYPAVPAGAPADRALNPYALMARLSENVPADSHIFADTGCTIAWLMQAFRLRGTQRTYHDFNNTAMGWALPAAIGGALALDGKPVLCLAGDGSLMMNLQELATVARLGLNLKLMILDNSGYSMVRQTEEQWLGGINVGTSTESGLGFPDFLPLARAFGIGGRSIELNSEAEPAIAEAFATDGPYVIHAKIDPAHRVIPQVAFGYPIEDPEPHLPRAEFLANMIVEPMPKSLEPTPPERTLPERAAG